MATTGRGTPSGMRLFQASTGSTDLMDMLKQVEAGTTDNVRMVLELVRKDVLYFLKSYTDVQRPPRYQRKFTYDATLRRVKVSNADRTGWRPAHPGGWADVSLDLKAKYYTEVTWEQNGWRLTIGNRSEHAVYVEARDGYFVVHGVLEPNGPVARAIRKAIKELGVQWKFTSGGLTGGPAGLATALDISPKTGQAAAPTLDLGAP